MFMEHAKLSLLLGVTEYKEVFEETDPASIMDLSEEAMRVVAVFSKALILVCYLNNVEFCNLVELNEESTVRELRAL